MCSRYHSHASGLIGSPTDPEDAQRREVVLRRPFDALLHERPDGGRRAVQDRDLVVLDDLPPAVPGRRIRCAFVHDPGRGVGQRPVDDVAVAGHPADVGGAPVHVVRLDIEDRLVGEGRAEEVAGGGMEDALRLGRRARGVEQIEHVLRLDRDGRAVLGLAIDEVVPPMVAVRHHVDVVAETPDHDRGLDGGRVGERLVGVMLEPDLLAATVATVRGDQDLGAAVVDPARQRLGREAAEDDRVRRADPRAGEHRDRQLGDHRHVDGDPVAGLDAELLERVGRLADLALEVARR